MNMKLLRFNIIYLNILIFCVTSMVIEGTVTGNNSYGSFTIFQDFKAVLMYFSEAFLKGATFGSKKLEGEMRLLIPKKLIEILGLLKSEYSHYAVQDARIERLATFREQLQSGYEVAVILSEMSYQLESRKSLNNIVEKSIIVQNFAISMFNDKNKQTLVIPSGWVGHATVLIIKKSENDNDLYDLIYVNTGQGLQHHYHQPDPNNVYPHLSRLWLEFKGIPKDLIFDPNSAWFIYALYSISDQDSKKKLVKSLNDDKNTFPNYFYGTLLANFKKYLVEPEDEKITEKLFPEQQSGSCTMSSLLGALLYYSDCMEDFHWYRLKIGHVILKNFLDRLQTILADEVRNTNEFQSKKILLFKGELLESDADFEFVNVLRDAFLSGGSRLFYGLVRALANLQLQYFEHKFPDEFMHAGLIGSGRSKWIAEKKTAAIAKLVSDETARDELKRTLDLAKSVHQNVLGLKYRPETTHIQNLSEINDYFAGESVYFEIELDDNDEAIDKQFTLDEGGNIYRNIVEGVPERLESDTPIHTFDAFYNDFDELFKRDDNHNEVYFMKFLDIFKRLRAGSGWSLIQFHLDQVKLIELQEMCKILALKFGELSKTMNYETYASSKPKATMDEVALLGHLQLLSWHLFRALHNLFHQDNDINWDELVPPSTVQNVLFGYGKTKSHISGNFEKWSIKGFNDIENYRLYELFIMEGRSNEKTEYNFFPGPEELLYQFDDDNFICVKSKFENFLKNKNLKTILEKFMDIDEVESILTRLKTTNPNWSDIDTNYAKFLIVLSAGQKSIYLKIPHFYNLMYTLSCLQLGVKSNGIGKSSRYEKESEIFWIKHVSGYRPNPNEVRMLLSSSRYEGRSHPISLFKNNILIKELFYVIRHSYALPEEVGMTDVDTWFNYIENAKTAKIFHDPYFQYLTDHLLNIPKYRQGLRESIFTEAITKQIILELIKLIRLTFEVLSDDSDKLTMLRREQIVRRGLNMAVITTRFISRTDYEFRTSNDRIDWAVLLAQLYNTIEPYSYFNSPILKLTDPQVSMINLALSHMCFTSLIIPDYFTDAINLGFDYPYKRHRRTLARVHWFIAKINYTLSSNEMIADDQFKYGFLGSPLKDEEIRFFEAFLKVKFLNPYLKIEPESDYSFRYESGRYVVEITTPSDVSMSLFINLATGTIIKNGLMLCSKSSFIYSYEFRTYFSPQDQKYLSTVGEAYVINGLPIFMLPNLKGSDYLMFKYVDKIWLLRKWEENWYIWRPVEKYDSFFKSLSFRWEKNPIKTFIKNKSTSREVVMLVFDDGDKDPILKMTKVSEYTTSYQLIVPGLTDEIIAAKIISNIKYKEMHLSEFAEEGITYSRQESDGTVVVIYNNHRLPDDPLKPFVITSGPDGKLLVRNVSEMEICQDQRIGKDGFGLPGCLVASFEKKKVLLAPFAEVIKKSKTKDPPPRPYINIEKIPIVELLISETDSIAIPAPQSRMHKLLLAYYMILAQNFDSARKLLHPSTSIHHNSMFSEEELKIIGWVLGISMESIEYNALALTTISHFLINDAKFSFDYTEKVLEASKIVMGKNPSKIFETYMMSIRELPEKYSVFKIFPEMLDDENSVLSNAFFCEARNERTRIHFDKISESFQFPDWFSGNASEFEFGERSKLDDFLRVFSLNSLVETNLMKHLLIRNRSIEKFDNSFEMAIHCYIKNNTLWKSFKMKYAPNSTIHEDVKNQFKSIIESCNMSEEFDGISLARISKSTNLKKIQETMRLDLNIFQDSINELSNHSITINTEEEKSRLINFKKKLMEAIKTTGNCEVDSTSLDSTFAESSKVLGGFISSINSFITVESSKVLGGLMSSIESFITDEGRKHCNIFNLKSSDNLVLFTELEELNQLIINRIDSLESEQKDLSSMLATNTNPKPEDLLDPHMIENLFAMMHQRKQKIFSDLYACYLKRSFSCIQSKFPQLNTDQCEKVQNESILFFSQSILLNYLKMIQKSARAFLDSDSAANVDDLMIFCREIEKISDFNVRLQNPVIMNFEFRSSKYCLKSEQVSDIELLTSEESDNFKSVVIQRMMAAGKTLVLGTVSVVMKALKRNDRLSILVPPSSLYQSNTTAMQARTYHYFKKKGSNFNFPRLPLPNNQEFACKVSAFLDNVISIINHTMNNRNYLILSPDHLQSFLNSYIEAIEGAKVLCKDYNYQNYIKILKKFATIYRIFKEKTSIILDEIDMTMDPKKELNFPTIETEYYNTIAVVLLADIIEFMLFSNEIKDAGLNIYSNNQASMTPENYVECKKFVLKYIESQLEDEKSMWRMFVPEKERKNVMEFLSSEIFTFKKNWIIEIAEGNHADLANALVILKTQLYLHFEEFLGATVNQNYGSAGPLRPNLKYAVPYVAANTPSAGSVFADRWETLIKTILMISVSPCSFETAKEVIKYVRKSILEESANDSNIDLKSLPTFKNMSLILPENVEIMALDEKESVDVAIVHETLTSRSPAAIRVLYSYYINEIIYKMEFPVEQITSNALHMTSMFASVQGYSGTIDNVNTLPQRVVEDASKDRELNEKNNGGIALKLIQDFENEVIPELIDESFTLSADYMMRAFFRIFENKSPLIDQLSAIIDTGAFFKNFKNRAVAEAILIFFDGRIKVVMYYDEASNQLEFIQAQKDGRSFTKGFLDTTDPDDIEKTTHAKIEERFTFYDQRHITGSDILQPKSAIAIMTASPRVLLRDILQGTLRMRQFMTSQKVHLVITESLRKFYNSKIKGSKTELRVSDLITLGALNEDEKQIHENEKLAFVKIDSEIRSLVLDEISKYLSQESVDRSEFERIISLYSENRDLFTRSIRENPISWLRERTPQNTVIVLEHHVTLRLAKLIPFFNTLEENSRFSELKAKLERMYKSDYANRSDSLLKYLKTNINVRKDDTIGTEMVAQNQTQTLTLMDLDLDLKQLVKQKRLYNWSKNYEYKLLQNNIESMLKDESIPVPDTGYDFYSLKYIYGSQPESGKQRVHSVLLKDGSRVFVTTDLLQPYENTDDSSNKFPIFSEFTLEGTHFLVFAPAGQLDDPSVILLSPRHAASIFNDLETNDRDTYRFCLCDLSGNVKILNIPSDMQTTSFKRNVFEIEEFGPNLEKLIFDLLIFNGSFPQILANSKIRGIYENEWINEDNFMTRALFLRMRMKALAEKYIFMFEDDDEDYIRLKRYSSGDSQKETNGGKCTLGYVKCAIKKEIQDAFNVNYPSLSSSRESKNADKEIFNFTSTDTYNKLIEIFTVFNEASAVTNAEIESYLQFAKVEAQSENMLTNSKKRKFTP